MRRPRVLLADDHRIVGEGLKELLTPEFELLGLVENGRTLLEEAKKLRPDVIVADITMPDLNGIDALAQLKKNDPGVKVVFLWAREFSTLQAKNGRSEDLTDMNVDNYHAIFTYNWGDEDAVTRPFLFGGLGATSFAPEDIGGQAIDGETRFSGTWGGGVKIYPTPTVGFTAMARWTPNYIKSDPAGVWCSPYWFYGCYVVGDPQYANQFEFSGGLSFRF